MASISQATFPKKSFAKESENLPGAEFYSCQRGIVF